MINLGRATFSSIQFKLGDGLREEIAPNLLRPIRSEHGSKSERSLSIK
jgi:hypothetical protein